MKRIISHMNSVAMVIGYVIVIYYLGSVMYGNLYRYHKVDPHESCGIGARNVIAEEYSKRSLTGDGVSMAVWAAYPTTEDILYLIDRRQIDRGRIWFPGPFNPDEQKAFEWLAGTKEYTAINKHVEQIINGEYFYSIDRLNLQGKYIGNAALWIVSPKLRLIAYLDYDT